MQIDDFITAALAEDIGDGDHTSLATNPPHQQDRAVLIAKEKGIVAGIRIAEKVYIKSIDLSLKAQL